MKQVNNIKFYGLEDESLSNVKIVYPNNTSLSLPFKKAKQMYMKLYAEKVIDNLILDTLKEAGTTLKKAHLCNYSCFVQVKEGLTKKLYEHQIDLTMNKIKTRKLGFILEGNVSEIVKTILIYLWVEPWNVETMSRISIQGLISSCPTLKVYKRDSLPALSVSEASRYDLLNIIVGNRLTIERDSDYNILIP